MDALVNGLMEELNCETVFTIPLFGGIPIYESVVVTWIIMAALAIVFFLLGRNLSVEHPGRRQIVVETGVKFLHDFFDETVGEKGKAYIPYLSAVAIYIGVANLIGLLGFKPPTKGNRRLCRRQGPVGTDEYRIDPGFQRSCQGYERLAEKFCRTYAGRLTDQYPGTFYQAIVPMYATVW